MFHLKCQPLCQVSAYIDLSAYLNRYFQDAIFFLSDCLFLFFFFKENTISGLFNLFTILTILIELFSIAILCTNSSFRERKKETNHLQKMLQKFFWCFQLQQEFFFSFSISCHAKWQTCNLRFFPWDISEWALNKCSNKKEHW